MTISKSRSPQDSGPRRAASSGADVSLRAVGLGALLSVAINVACPYSVLVLHNAGLTSDYLAAGAMMLFLVLVGLE